MWLRRKLHRLTGIPPFRLTSAPEGARLTSVPEGTTPLLLTSPHSGHYVPPEAQQYIRLPMGAIRCMEDAHVDLLLEKAVARGIPLMAATHSRAVLDLNRAVDEFDPGMFAGPLPIQAKISNKVRRGFGLVPFICGPGQRIHRGKLPAHVLADRIRQLHRPWHEAIAANMALLHSRFGMAVVLDVHSMPTLDGEHPADIVIGDRFGQSAAGWMVDFLVSAFGREGLRVARNVPYAGGYTTANHGQPDRSMHAIQIEIDRALYMNPTTLEPHPGFTKISNILDRVIGALGEALLPRSMAAE